MVASYALSFGEQSFTVQHNAGQFQFEFEPGAHSAAAVASELELALQYAQSLEEFEGLLNRHFYARQIIY